MHQAEFDDVIRLLDSATGRSAVEAAVAAIGPERAADILVHEVEFRASLDELARDGETLPIDFVLRHGDTTIERRLSVGPDDAPAAAVTVVSQELVEMALCLFGPRELVAPATLTIRWPDLWPDMDSFKPEFPRPPRVLDVGRRINDVLARRVRPDLGYLAVRYGSDKWGAHRYAPRYEHHLAPLVDRRLNILEIGIGGYDATSGGASLSMWKHFFPRAHVHGIDLYDKSAVNAPRISTAAVDQSDPAALVEFAERHGPFDVIIDDGSHVPAHVITSFEALFPLLPAGGLYVVEDLQASYWPFFQGNPQDLNDPTASVGFLKTLVDGLNHEEILSVTGRPAAPADEWLSAMHLYHNLAFLEKGGNREGSPARELFEQMMAGMHAS